MLRTTHGSGAALLLIVLTGCSGGMGNDAAVDGRSNDGGSDVLSMMDIPTPDVVRTDGGSDVPGIDAPGSDAADASAGPAACMQYAMAVCSGLSRCAPYVLRRTYESMTVCVEQIAFNCTNIVNSMGAAPQAVRDPMGCATALGGSCDAFWEAYSHPPLACRPPSGTLAMSARCGVSQQCGTDAMGAQLYCFEGSGPGCSNAMCGPSQPPNGPRNMCRDGLGRDLCDSFNGYDCLSDFDPTSGASPAGPNCQRPMYGGVGAQCFAATNRQCQAGLVCNRARQCTMPLGNGATCNIDDDLCDRREGLVCSNSMNGIGTCAAQRIAAVGEACGPMGTEVVICSDVALCTFPGNRCELRRRRGEMCTSAGQECRPGLVCRSNRCELPACR